MTSWSTIGPPDLSLNSMWGHRAAAAAPLLSDLVPLQNKGEGSPACCLSSPATWGWWAGTKSHLMLSGNKNLQASIEKPVLNPDEGEEKKKSVQVLALSLLCPAGKRASLFSSLQFYVICAMQRSAQWILKVFYIGGGTLIFYPFKQTYLGCVAARVWGNHLVCNLSDISQLLDEDTHSN